ncbi:MAG: Crp/Fnr family transcriptional regulator [Hyphomicrobiales bacterium]
MIPGWSVQSAAQVLRSKGWFSQQPQWFQDGVIERATLKEFHAGGVVCRAGDAPMGAHAVVEGQVNFVWPSPDGQEIFYNFIPPAGWFGHGSCIDGEPYLMNAVTPRRTVMLFLARDRFEDLGKAHPEAFRCWATQVTDMYRGVFQSFIDAKAFEARQRVPRALLVLARKAGERVGDSVELNVRLTQAEFASFVGVTRQYASRFIGELREAGILDWGASRIVIRNLPALAEMADPRRGAATSGA